MMECRKRKGEQVELFDFCNAGCDSGGNLFLSQHVACCDFALWIQRGKNNLVDLNGIKSQPCPAEPALL